MFVQFMYGCTFSKWEEHQMCYKKENGSFRRFYPSRAEIHNLYAFMYEYIIYVCRDTTVMGGAFVLLSESEI